MDEARSMARDGSKYLLVEDAHGTVLSGKRAGLYAVLLIIAVHLTVTLLTLAVSAATGTTFVFWFKDTPIVLLVVLLYMSFLGVVWDGSLIIIGMVFQGLRRFGLPGGNVPVSVESVRRIRFFTCGASPMIMLLITAIAVLGTSNVTLIHLKLLGTVTHWNDPLFWKLEGGVIEWVTSLNINAAAWDKLYHSAWAIELGAAFVLIVLGRGPKLVLCFSVSMIILFYVGRLLGVLNPVMGPSFFRPDLYGYLDGSVTNTAMKYISQIMAMGPEQVKSGSGVLIGGVSAVPSLHVGMVSLTAYWLAVTKRWTLILTVPWVLLVWTSTVVLGWHYIIDGAGGIVLAVASVWAARWIVGLPWLNTQLVRIVNRF